MEEGLADRALACQDSIKALTRLQFGPPTAWEIFTTLCKGDCRSYSDRIARIRSTSCDCRKVTNPQYQCPTFPTAYLCEELQICLNYDAYRLDYCDTASCGRFATNEDAWRKERALCSAAAPAPALALILLVLAAALQGLLAR